MALKWGILGCGDVAEYKGGPPLYNVEGSELIAVMRRDATKAESFADKNSKIKIYYYKKNKKETLYQMWKRLEINNK